MTQAVKPGRYRHWKGDTEYVVIGVATHSEAPLEAFVIYRDRSGLLWARPLAMWSDSVRVHGELVPRFSYVGEAAETALQVGDIQ